MCGIAGILTSRRSDGETAIERRLQSDVPVGVVLSGGVDSSLVSLIAAERSPRPIRTFTASFSEREFETHHARLIVRRAASLHREIAVSMDAPAATLARLARVYGEPFGDDSAIPTLALFDGLKPNVKVALTGDGGDEVFANYKDVRAFLARRSLRWLVGAGDLAPFRGIDRLIQDRRRWLRQLGYGIAAVRSSGAELYYALHRGGWLETWRRSAMRPEAWRATGQAGPEIELREQFAAGGASDLERYLNLSFERLTQGFLVKIDRAAMENSIAARSPLLDVDLFQWVSGLPLAVLLHEARPKALLKDLLDERVGAPVSRRSKMGFTPPLSSWLRRPATVAWVKEKLGDRESLAYRLFEPSGLGRLIRRHAEGADHTGRLWKLLVLNEWHAWAYGAGRPAPDVARASDPA